MATYEIVATSPDGTPSAVAPARRAAGATLPESSSLNGREARWLTFLGGWSLFAALVYVGLFIVIGLISPASQGSTLPPEYDEFVWAISSPGLYRVANTLDATAWLALGGFFTALAALTARGAPIRSVLIAACGVGQVAGLVGAFTRLGSISDVATRYAAAATDQQAILLRSYLDLQLVLNAHFGAGSLLWSAGLLLTASAALSIAAFPRWLVGLIALTGVVNLAGDIQGIAGGQPPFVMFVLPLAMLTVVFFAVAWVCRRRMPALAGELSGAAAG